MNKINSPSQAGRLLGYGSIFLFLFIFVWYIRHETGDSEPGVRARRLVEPAGEAVSASTGPRIGPDDIRVAELSRSRVIVTHVISERVNNFAIDGQFRYIFDVRNHGPRPFRGEVGIDVARSVSAARQASFGGDTFPIEKAIEPGEGTDVYLDRYTAPAAAHIHGEYGIRVFKWVVSVDGRVVNSGVDSLNDKYEDLVNR